MTLNFYIQTPQQLRLSGIEDMMQEHWQEVAGYKDLAPLAFDWLRCNRLHKLGQLKCYRVDKDGGMIGYNLFLLSPQLYHARTMWAFNQGIYIGERHRRSSAGTFAIRRAEEELAKLGVGIVSYHDSVHHDRTGSLGRLLERLGYQLDANQYGKALR